MKRYINTLIFLACAFATFAQSPQKFNYQAVARNAQGAVLPNQNVTIRASMLDGSASGTSQYSETHSTTTSQLGLFNLAIGGGTVVSGNFANITWANGDKYLKIEMDPAGGNNFVLVGTSQLLSVPYALYAKKSEPVPDKTEDNAYNSPAAVSLNVYDTWIDVPNAVVTAPSTGDYLILVSAFFSSVQSTDGLEVRIVKTTDPTDIKLRDYISTGGGGGMGFNQASLAAGVSYQLQVYNDGNSSSGSYNVGRVKVMLIRIE